MMPISVKNVGFNEDCVGDDGVGHRWSLCPGRAREGHCLGSFTLDNAERCEASIFYHHVACIHLHLASLFMLIALHLEL